MQRGLQKPRVGLPESAWRRGALKASQTHLGITGHRSAGGAGRACSSALGRGGFQELQTT